MIDVVLVGASPIEAKKPTRTLMGICIFSALGP